MPIEIPKHAIATHPIRKTIDGVSKYTPIFVRLNLNHEVEKEIATNLAALLDNPKESEIRVLDNGSLCYSFNALVKQMRSSDVFTLEVASGAVRYPRQTS